MVKLPKAEDCCQQSKAITHVLVTGPLYESLRWAYPLSDIGKLRNYGPLNVKCGHKTLGPVGFWICEDCQRRLGLIW